MPTPLRSRTVTHGRTAAGARLRALLARGELGLTVNDVREPRGPA